MFGSFFQEGTRSTGISSDKDDGQTLPRDCTDDRTDASYCSSQDNDEESQLSTRNGAIIAARARPTPVRGDDEDSSSRGTVLSNQSTKRSSTSLPANAIVIPILFTSILVSISVPDILCFGLLYAGFDLTRQRKNNEARRVEWFKSFYGVEPATVSPFFRDLRNKYPDINLKVALMTMQWLFLYPTYPVLSGQVSA